MYVCLVYVCVCTRVQVEVRDQHEMSPLSCETSFPAGPNPY